jgi:hypothetical protein
MSNIITMKHILLTLILVIFSFASFASDQTIVSAYETQTSNVQVGSSGIVVKILSDDNTGSRHQRFILKLSTGHTILIAHNIDLAPKIDILNVGDSVEFYGEYEWNNKGGVVSKPITSASMLATSWLDSLSAASFVHGFAIVAQTNQLQACPLCERYISWRVRA